MLLVAQVSVYLMDTKSKAMIPISNADRWVTDGTGNLRWKFQGNPFLFMGNVSDPPLDLVPGTCDPGQYLIPDPPQKGKPVTGRCEVCGAGYYTVEGMTGKHDTTGCTACVAGTFQSYGGATGCSSCAAGEFTDSSGRSQCLQCSKGTFQPNTSSTACEDCAPGDPRGWHWPVAGMALARGGDGTGPRRTWPRLAAAVSGGSSVLLQSLCSSMMASALAGRVTVG